MALLEVAGHPRGLREDRDPAGRVPPGRDRAGGLDHRPQRSGQVHGLQDALRAPARPPGTASASTGEDVTNRPPADLLRRGMAYVPQGRNVFPLMTVDENLRLGAYIRPRSAELDREVERVYETFPMLRAARRKRAAELSGGQQQMLEMGAGPAAAPAADAPRRADARARAARLPGDLPHHRGAPARRADDPHGRAERRQGPRDLRLRLRAGAREEPLRRLRRGDPERRPRYAACTSAAERGTLARCPSAG